MCYPSLDCSFPRSQGGNLAEIDESWSRVGAKAEYWQGTDSVTGSKGSNGILAVVIGCQSMIASEFCMIPSSRDDLRRWRSS